MTIPVNNYEGKVEEVVRQYLDAATQTALPIYLAFDFSECTDAVYVQVLAYDCETEVQGIGGGDVNVDVAVFSKRQVSRTQHEEAVGQIMDLIFNDEFLTELNKVPGTLGINVILTGTRTRSLHGENLRVTRQSLTVNCYTTEE